MNSIKEIAIKAGVSVGTVDRVIHNRTGVSKKTKEKIQKIIEEHNFQINPVASSLASKKVYKIAYLIPDPLQTEFWNAPLKGILTSASEQKNYGIKIKEFKYDQFSILSYQKAFESLIKHEPNAALIAPIFLKETGLLTKKLDQNQIPYCFINTEFEDLNNLSFIGQKSFESGYLAAKMLHLSCAKKTNYSIVNFRENIENYSSIKKRIAGFHHFFNQNQLIANFQNISIESNYNIQQIETLLKAHFLEDTAPCGLFVPSSRVDIIANVLENLNLNNIGLIGYDTTPNNIIYLEKNTIDFLISQKPYEQGYFGIKILSDYLIYNKKPKKNYFTPIEIITKENVAFMSF